MQNERVLGSMSVASLNVAMDNFFECTACPVEDPNLSL